jgi:LPXTG-motif cell wall-anchored protein
VRAFQAWAGITADGLIGPQTTSTLAAKLSGGAIFPVGPKVAGVPVVPVAIGAIALGGLAWWFLRKRKR